ncbi:MAG: hypothetical protein N3E46_12760 [Gemmataceae bacterium]|nr:hypothetical protein [Gemmataceae bacterium]
MNSRSLTHRWKVYGPPSFQLTQAVRPAPQAMLQPQQGYRLAVFQAGTLRMPMLSAAVSAEHLFEVFLELVSLIGDCGDVVVESTHGLGWGQSRLWRRAVIDQVVLIIHLWEFELLLMHDGCTAIAVINRRRPAELQLDEHKLVHVYSPHLRPFQRCLSRWGIPRCRRLPLICEADHIHHTQPHFAQELTSFLYLLGAEEERQARR